MSKSTKLTVAVVVVIILVGAAIYFVAKSKIIHGIGGGDTGPGNSINVVSLGADSGGKSDSSKAVLAAWKAACKSSGKSTIFFPEGRYLISSPVAISGKECKAGEVNFDVNKATLTGPPDYKDLGDSKDWFSFDAVGGLSITGGVFDAQAHGLYECKKSGDGCPTGATSLRFSDSSNIELNGVKSVNSQLYHIVFHGCKKVKVEGVKITAPGDSPNTDGIHVQLSSDVTIFHSDVGTGDDCVSVGPGTTKLWIENMACGPGHGISIGSLGKERDEEGVEDVTVKTVTFTGTTNGVRIKSWGRKSDGFVKKVLFQDIKIDNAENPIIIDQNYCPHHEDCPGKDSGIQISDVTYQSIHGSSASEIGVKLDCSSDSPCENIIVEDVDLSYHGEAAQSSCDNVEGLTPNIC